MYVAAQYIVVFSGQPPVAVLFSEDLCDYDNTQLAVNLPVSALHIDLVRAPQQLDEVLTLLSPIGSLPQLANIKVKVGIPKLMDALFAVEEALFAERHGPVAESDGEPFNSGLFTAA